MATPYFVKDADYVYFDYGPRAPYPTNYDHPQSVGRSEDQKLKVYDHSLGDTYKRTWRFKAMMNDNAASDHNFSDLVAFITATTVHAKYQFTYYDMDGNSHTVRLVGWSERERAPGLHEVTLILEEDYA